MDTMNRNRFWQPFRRTHDGDNAAPGELNAQRENALVAGDRAPLAEMGGGDMTDNIIHGPWMNVDHQQVRVCRIRLLSISVNVITLVLIPLMILTLFVLLNMSITLIYGWASRQDSDYTGLRMEIYGTINNGYVLSQYMHVMNEALFGLLTKRPSAISSGEIRELKDAYETLIKIIQKLLSIIHSNDETVELPT